MDLFIFVQIFSNPLPFSSYTCLDRIYRYDLLSNLAVTYIHCSHRACVIIIICVHVVLHSFLMMQMYYTTYSSFVVLFFEI